MLDYFRKIIYRKKALRLLSRAGRGRWLPPTSIAAYRTAGRLLLQDFSIGELAARLPED